MSRYDEVCSKIKNTHDIMKESQRSFEKLFKEQLAEYLECSQDMIVVQYDAPCVQEDGVCCDFSISIRFKNLNIDETVTIPGFTYKYKESGGEYAHEIDYDREYFDLYSHKELFFKLIYSLINQQYVG